MFTPQQRDALSSELVTACEADTRIVSAALMGSAAVAAEDDWSDIDLAFGIDPAAERSRVIADWTDRICAEF